MKMKLECTLRLKTDAHTVEIAQDVNLVNIDLDSMSDQAVKAFFDRLRHSMFEKYKEHVYSLLEVDIKDVSSV